MKEEKFIVLENDFIVDNFESLLGEAMDKGFYEIKGNNKYLNFLVTKKQFEKFKEVIENHNTKYTPNFFKDQEIEEYKGNVKIFESYLGVQIKFIVKSPQEELIEE